MTEDCGLSDWPTNMQIDHAVSRNATGPYVKMDTALPAPATNPQAIIDARGVWWLFHIGDAHGASAKNCTDPPQLPQRRADNVSLFSRQLRLLRAVVDDAG